MTANDIGRADGTMTRFAGIFPILQTPFDESGAIDFQSLRREIDFCLRAGVHEWSFRQRE